MSHCGVKCHVHGIRSFEKLRDHLLFAVTDHHDGALQCPRCKNYVCNICIRSYISLLHTRLKSISYQLLKHQMFKDMINTFSNYSNSNDNDKDGDDDSNNVGIYNYRNFIIYYYLLFC